MFIFIIIYNNNNVLYFINNSVLTINKNKIKYVSPSEAMFILLSG